MLSRDSYHGQEHGHDAKQRIQTLGLKVVALSCSAAIKQRQDKIWDALQQVHLLSTTHVRCDVLTSIVRLSNNRTELASAFSHHRPVEQSNNNTCENFECTHTDPAEIIQGTYRCLVKGCLMLCPILNLGLRAGSYLLPWRCSCICQCLRPFVCTWAQDERPVDLHMAQPNVPVSKTGQFVSTYSSS
jgi:hypothetical protein